MRLTFRPAPHRVRAVRFPGPSRHTLHVRAESGPPAGPATGLTRWRVCFPMRAEPAGLARVPGGHASESPRLAGRGVLRARDFATVSGRVSCLRPSSQCRASAASMVSHVPTGVSRVTRQSIVRAAGRVPAPWSQGIVSLGRIGTGRSGLPALPLLTPGRFARSRLSLP